MESLFEHAGGWDRLHGFIDIFYRSCIADPLLHPLFGAGRPEHIPHLTALLSEVFGGPTRYTAELGGFPSLLAPHRSLGITEAQVFHALSYFFDHRDEILALIAEEEQAHDQFRRP